MVNYWTDMTSTTTGDDWYTNYTGTSTPSSLDFVRYTVVSTTQVVRKLLVRQPKNWSKRDQDAFINLVNKNTNTGWKIEMIISGDIELVDHSIEVVSMQSFSEILRSKANGSDQRKIDTFFDEMLE